jgi:mono/diheme cytochrome c family protein
MRRFLWVAAAALALAAPARAEDAAAEFAKTVMPVLAARCVGCHGGETPEAKLDLSGQRPLDQLAREGEKWFQVMERIESGSMPPEDAEPLDAAEKQAVIAWARGPFTNHLAAVQKREGRAQVRRLTRDEYSFTILDLFGFTPGARQYLPDDGRVDGYDKIADAVPFSAASAEGYLRLADSILAEALKPAPKEGPPLVAKAFHSEQSAGHILELPDGWMVSFNTDLYSGPLRGFQPRLPGVHRLKMHVYGYQTDKPLPFAVYAGPGGFPQVLEIVKVLEAPPGGPAVVEADVYLHTKGNGDLGAGGDTFRLVPLGLGVPVPKNHQASECKGPGLAVLKVEIEEPEWPTPQVRRLLADFSPDTLAAMGKPASWFKKNDVRGPFLTEMEATIRRIGPLFFRRNLGEGEIKALEQLALDRYDTVEPTINPVKAAFVEVMTSLMTSPDFLCRIENPGPLDDFAIASRLSSFLWNSCPDEPLLAAARSGRLRSAEGLREQTDRMLADPRSSRFVKGFTDQWLGLWGIDSTTPDKDVYPGYEDLLRHSSLEETRGTFARMLAKDRSVRDFVAPGWALLNARLADHYGIPGVDGVTLREVPLPSDSPYGGLLTHSATMKVTANGTVTSPVKRGVWVAERLLGVEIPSPPANIEPISPDTRGATTLREQLALHSQQASCAACHAKFDGYGFALESFDVTGRYREKYRVLDHEVAKLPPEERRGRQRWKEGLPVDAAGVTPDGKKFGGVRDLRTLLAADPSQLARGVTRHLLTYATGAPATPVDDPAIEAIAASTAASNYGLRSIVHAVIQSDAFRSK